MSCEIEININKQVDQMWHAYKTVLKSDVDTFFKILEEIYYPNIHLRDNLRISKHPVMVGVMLGCDEVLKKTMK